MDFAQPKQAKIFRWMWAGKFILRTQNANPQRCLDANERKEKEQKSRCSNHLSYLFSIGISSENRELIFPV